MWVFMAWIGANLSFYVLVTFLRTWYMQSNDLNRPLETRSRYSMPLELYIAGVVIKYFDTKFDGT